MTKARENQMNYAIAQVLGWCLGKEMSLNFEVFDACMLILAVVVVSSFLKDGKTDWLEGGLGVCVYVLIAVAAFYYPNPGEGGEHGHVPGQSAQGKGAAGGGER
jgi:Ca2+:H+ antiporter